jgi:hypothetical protein
LLEWRVFERWGDEEQRIKVRKTECGITTLEISFTFFNSPFRVANLLFVGLWL